MRFSRTTFLIAAALAAIDLSATSLHAEPLSTNNLNSSTNLVDESGPAPALPADDNEQQQFVKAIDDLPLMPGLHTEQNNDVLFVTPRSGRIVETMAVGSVDIDDVYNFYRKSLPQLGWQIVDVRTYQRGNDILRIDARADDKMTTVEFTVRPADK